MATGGKKDIGSKLRHITALTLEPGDLDPLGVVVVGDKLVITDFKSYKVFVYRRHDGTLLSSSDRLKSIPYGVCFIDNTDVCVAMNNGTIIVMSVSDSDLISRGKTFDLRPSFDSFDGVAASRDGVVVSGLSDNMICWCVVSLQDGRRDHLQKVCRGKFSFLTTKDNMVYISCYADSPDDRGVYGFNLLNPSQPILTYKPEGLVPFGITVDGNGHLFLCDKGSNSIHQLTDKCDLVAIYTEGIPLHPFAIFWDCGIMYMIASGILYVTEMSNVITIHATHCQGTGIPMEIMNMDDRSIQLFEKALKDGKEKIYSIRVMVVGHLGVGKTTLIKRLLGKDVNISERHSTEGIDVHLHCCDVSLSSSEWTLRKKDSEQDYRLQRALKILNEKQLRRNELADEKQIVLPHKEEITNNSARNHVSEEPNSHSTQPDLKKKSAICY